MNYEREAKYHGSRFEKYRQPGRLRKYEKVASRAGVQVVCSDEDEKELAREGALDLSGAQDCENMKTVASKVGMQVVCDDDE